MARIALIVHRYDRLYRAPFRRDPVYVILLTLQILEQRGHEVVVVRGRESFQGADAAILHVDCTFVPPEYLELAARFPRCLNATCADISKRTVSGALVEAHPTWSGPVIVKTNLNSRGVPERLHNRRARWQGHPPPHPRVRRLPHYAVFPTFDAVPDRYRGSPDHVVEIYNPQPHVAGHGVFSWQFLDDTGFCYLAAGDAPVLRMGNAPVVEDRPPPDLEAERRRLGLDYGKLDFILLDGKPVVIDANKTLSAGDRPDWTAPDRGPDETRSFALERALGIA
jgi:hypothetical protein